MNQEIKKQVLMYLRDNLANIEFKAPQPGEEISDDAKLQRMTELLEINPGLFLTKWGRFLSQRILQHFKEIEGNDEVDIHLRNLLQDDETQTPMLHTVIRNRRFEYLKRNLRNSPYFSDEAIQLRDPALYEQYIGQYIPKSEKIKPFADDISLSNRILANIDQQGINELLIKLKKSEDEQFEEEDEDSDDEATEANGKAMPHEDASMATEEVQERRDEMLRLLEERFLAGKESEFDYSEVDHNENYDDLKQQEEDIHDSYFDDEDEDTDSTKPTVYTGELDY